MKVRTGIKSECHQLKNHSLQIPTTVIFKEETPQGHLQEVVVEGFVAKEGEEFAITPKGLDEKNRLCTLAGLNIKYQTEKLDEKKV